MSEIIVRNQKEWNDIPKDYNGCISIQDTDSYIIVAKRKGFSVVVGDKSSVVVKGSASVEARDNSYVEAWGSASVVAWGNASVVAGDNASVEAYGNSSVVAWDKSSVESYENSSVVAWDNSYVEAWENSYVEAWGGASVEAYENSFIKAWESSYVEAWGGASVEAWGSAQIVKYSDFANLKIQGNARIVTPPDTVQEYCDFYGIITKNGHAILYKAVKSDCSTFHDRKFKYKIGETFTNKCDSSREKKCSFGLHVSHMEWALDFGRRNDIDGFKILECAVPIDKIIVPKNSDGKIRTSELTVLREVPLEECGVMGKIILKQRENKLLQPLAGEKLG